MRVIYQLDTRDLKNVGEEARWAESMGYDGLYANERAHDPFLPLVLAATTTSHVTLETRVAIAFPRSPMVAAYPESTEGGRRVSVLKRQEGCSCASGIMVLSTPEKEHPIDAATQPPRPDPNHLRRPPLGANAGLLLPATLARHLGLPNSSGSASTWECPGAGEHERQDDDAGGVCAGWGRLH